MASTAKQYECRIFENDERFCSDWKQVKALDEEFAVDDFLQQTDSEDPERFQDPMRDEAIVEVRGGDLDEPARFEASWQA